jgi:hypothetical protein
MTTYEFWETFSKYFKINSFLTVMLVKNKSDFRIFYLLTTSNDSLAKYFREVLPSWDCVCNDYEQSCEKLTKTFAYLLFRSQCYKMISKCWILESLKIRLLKYLLGSLFRNSYSGKKFLYSIDHTIILDT